MLLYNIKGFVQSSYGLFGFLLRIAINLLYAKGEREEGQKISARNEKGKKLPSLTGVSTFGSKRLALRQTVHSQYDAGV